MEILGDFSQQGTAQNSMEIVGRENRKLTTNCKVCGQKCLHYHYYGVRTCQGCKQFFRRTIVKKQKPECKYNQTCNVLKGSTCRHCRLNRCLAVGMDPALVNNYISSKNEQQISRRENSQQNENQMKINLPNSHHYFLCLDETQKLLAKLSPLLAAHHKIWHSDQALVLAYSSQFEGTEDLLATPRNMLAKSDLFPEFSPPPCWDKPRFMDDLERNGLFSAHYLRVSVKDMFMGVELAKAMPFFGQLDRADQICLLQSIISPIMGLLPAYYSFQKSAKTMTLENGVMPIAILESRRYGRDKLICSIFRELMCDLVEKLHENCIGAEEFALFVGIICANSSPEKLSPFGRELLYEKCVSLTNSLHRLLQSRLGPLRGAQKFASLMCLLASVSSRITKLYLTISIYLEVFYEQKDIKKLTPTPLTFFHEQ